MVNHSDVDYQVVVVGAGPIGLTLANLLGCYGVKTLIIERHDSTVADPRAVSIDDESLRTMQACDLIDEVSKTIVSGYGSEYYSARGSKFLTVKPNGRPYGYPRRNAFRQPVLEAQLRGGLARYAHVEQRFSCALTDFTQDDQKVRLTVEQDGARSVLTCAYLVGADGAGSFVRTHLGLTLEGETFSEKWLIVDLENSPCASSETQVYCDVERPCIALPGPNQTRRFEFKLLPGENPETIAERSNVEALIARPVYGVPLGRVIRRNVVYTFHARLAPIWAVGRVFLAGDACHLTPPFAGQGMNSGVRDAHNLAWKLAYVVGGILPAKLLVTYEQERRDHVGQMIELALRMGRIMGPRNKFDAFVVQNFFRLLRIWPQARDYLAEMKYKPKPRFVRGFLIPDGDSVKDTVVGRLLPQPLVITSDGSKLLLDHLLGTGFALIGFTADASKIEALAQLPALERLNLRKLVLGVSKAAIASGFTAVEDESGILSALLGKRPNRAFLIRPDRYVAASVDLTDIEASMQLLGKLL
jgi:3-(3-hydroxy-phenyl)propionate hydroxylase